MNTLEQQRIEGPGGKIAVHIGGDAQRPVVLLSHSILSSSAMWQAQAELLLKGGFRVVCVDTRGHGASDAPQPPYKMSDLVADTVAVLDALQIDRVHFVGLSLGGMIGFGLGTARANRLSSLVICDARADAPEAFAAPWNDRIALAQKSGCAALAESTCERWFGKAFTEANPDIAERIQGGVASTSVEGLVGCARALQGVAYLDKVDQISTPITLLVGENDGPLPQAMRELSGRIRGSIFEVIPNAGHLPNIDQPDAFNAALLRHFERFER